MTTKHLIVLIINRILEADSLYPSEQEQAQAINRLNERNEPNTQEPILSVIELHTAYNATLRKILKDVPSADTIELARRLEASSSLLLRYLTERHHEEWDNQIARDSKSGKLDFLVEESTRKIIDS